MTGTSFFFIDEQLWPLITYLQDINRHFKPTLARKVSFWVPWLLNQSICYLKPNHWLFTLSAVIFSVNTRDVLICKFCRSAVYKPNSQSTDLGKTQWLSKQIEGHTVFSFWRYHPLNSTLHYHMYGQLSLGYCIFWRALSPYDCRVRLVRVTQHHFHVKSNQIIWWSEMIRVFENMTWTELPL